MVGIGWGGYHWSTRGEVDNDDGSTQPNNSTGADLTLPSPPDTGQIANQNTSPIPVKVEPAVFKFEDIKVGDSVGTMKVVAIDKIVSEMPLGPYNASIKLSGQVTLTGNFHYVSDTAFGIDAGLWFNELDASSLALLPRASHDPKSGFYFSNYNYAKTLFGPVGSSGPATIVIDEYTINLIESEVPNMAKLVRVVNVG